MNTPDRQLLELGADEIIRILGAAGHQAVKVGGYVRDRLLGKMVKDIDIATSAAPETVLSLFSHVIPTGLQHGTVTVMIRKIPYEVTTFRTESVYVGHRRPEAVEFIEDLEEDLRRRDFTINAMAIGANGELIDPFGGEADLRNGIIRCVGNADERFSEDALRMMRAVRFASRFGFTIEPDTWASLLRLAPLMEHIAMERVRAEFEQMLYSPDPAKALRMLASSCLLALTRTSLPYPFTETERMAASVDWLQRLPDEGISRWVFWGWLSGMDTEQLKNQLDRMTCPKHQVKSVSVAFDALIYWSERWEGLSRPFSVSSENDQMFDRTEWQKCIVRYGREAMKTVAELFQLWASQSDVRGLPWEQQLKRFEWLAGQAVTWDARVHVTHPSQLVVDGLQIAGWAEKDPGPWLSDMIRHVVEMVASEQLNNEPEPIRCYVLESLGGTDE